MYVKFHGCSFLKNLLISLVNVLILYVYNDIMFKIIINFISCHLILTFDVFAFERVIYHFIHEEYEFLHVFFKFTILHIDS